MLDVDRAESEPPGHAASTAHCWEAHKWLGPTRQAHPQHSARAAKADTPTPQHAKPWQCSCGHIHTAKDLCGMSDGTLVPGTQLQV